MTQIPHDCQMRWSTRWTKQRPGLKRSRAEIIRQAIERYLEEFDDLSVAVERLRDPNDPVLDWDQVRREFLDTD